MPQAVLLNLISTAAKPPVAKIEPRQSTLHGDTRTDDYFWLRDRKNPETIQYLEAENEYTQAVMKPTEELQATLYAEMLGRIAAIIARVPHRVVWVHNCGSLDDRMRVRRLTDRLLDRRTDAYFGVARAQTRYLVEDLGYPAHKIRIIHNGVDPAGYRPADEQRGRTTTWCARTFSSPPPRARRSRW